MMPNIFGKVFGKRRSPLDGEASHQLSLGDNFKKPLGPRHAHPTAASDEDILDLIRSTADEAVVFRRDFPPARDFSPHSFFGGLPRLPAGVAWPTSEPSGRAMTFIGQIDLATLPDFQLRRLLPEAGALAFFAAISWDLEDGGEPVGAVVFAPPSAGPAHERREPDNLRNIYGDDGGYYFPWLAARATLMPRSFHRWPVSPTVMTSFAEEHPYEADGNSAGRYRDLARPLQLEAVRTAFGEPAFRYWPGSADLNVLAPRPCGLAPSVHGSVWAPDDTWPYSWFSVDCFAGLLANHLAGPILRARNRGHESDLALFLGVIAEAEQWIAAASEAGLVSKPDPAAHAAFRRWCQDLAMDRDRRTGSERDQLSAFHVNKITETALQLTVDHLFAHSTEAAALAPDAAVDALRWRHSPFFADGRHATLIRHQLLGSPSVIQNAPERFRETHFLLFQFDSDAGIAWQWADAGAIQYWIPKAALAAHRFDQVVMTIEGH